MNCETVGRKLDGIISKVKDRVKNRGFNARMHGCYIEALSKLNSKLTGLELVVAANAHTAVEAGNEIEKRLTYLDLHVQKLEQAQK